MGINRTVATLADKIGGVTFHVYNKEGVLLGTENTFISAIKRSANENIAEFGREGIFRYNTLLTPGCLIHDENLDEKYFVSARRAQNFKRNVIIWSIYLIQVNCEATVQRKFLNVLDPDTVDFNFELSLIYSDIPAYIRKEDWTMESNTSIGREQKGYETLIVQESYDIKQGDIITVFQNKYIVQYITRYAKEGYLVIQLGIDVK
uniref:Uncharacterized protein n=1 Tax=viral metagenome TaxID=1070528 RepID=A0A6M3IGK3_9ZZZZ